jgi:hypothetical protein
MSPVSESAVARLWLAAAAKIELLCLVSQVASPGRRMHSRATMHTESTQTSPTTKKAA